MRAHLGSRSYPSSQKHLCPPSVLRQCWEQAPGVAHSSMSGQGRMKNDTIHSSRLLTLAGGVGGPPVARSALAVVTVAGAYTLLTIYGPHGNRELCLT